MEQNFTQIAFTDSVKKAQEKYGSREIYQKVEERGPDQSKLYLGEMEFVKQRESANAAGTPIGRSSSGSGLSMAAVSAC